MVKKAAKKKKAVRKKKVGLRAKLKAVKRKVTAHRASSSKSAKKRPWLHKEANRRLAYYGMGSAILGISFVFVAYQGMKEAENNAFRPEEARLESVSDRAPASQENPAISKALTRQFREVRDLSFEGRIGYWSHFLEANSHNRDTLHALVQGVEIDDTAPLIPKRYDCTTYVETVAALARSQHGNEFAKNLMAIRYNQGRSDYISRNHFPEADWIPNNERAEILKDITQTLAKDAGLVAQVETKTIERMKWLTAEMKKNKASRRIASVSKDDQWSQPVEAKVPYLSLAQLKKVVNDLPNGAVINLVHKDDGVHPVLISHQGFVIKEGNQVMFRHASRRGYIRSNELISYVTRIQKHSRANPNWPLVGVNIVQINDSASDTSRRSDAM